MNVRHRRTTLRAAPRRTRGATFGELMLATLIVGTTIVASISSLSESAEVYHFFSEGPHEALMLAQEVHEAAILLPWEAEAGAEANYGPDVVTLDDLHDAEFSPPRSADYEVISSHLSWKQRVNVLTVSMDDPTLVVDPETFEGEILTKLEVTILNGNTEVGVFPWWMTNPATEE